MSFHLTDWFSLPVCLISHCFFHYIPLSFAKLSTFSYVFCVVFTSTSQFQFHCSGLKCIYVFLDINLLADDFPSVYSMLVFSSVYSLLHNYPHIRTQTGLLTRQDASPTVGVLNLAKINKKFIEFEHCLNLPMRNCRHSCNVLRHDEYFIERLQNTAFSLFI